MTQATQRETRKAKAVKIYQKLIPLKPPGRKEVIEQLMSKLGMTKFGASTYYANIKTGKWSVEALPVRKAVKGRTLN